MILNITKAIIVYCVTAESRRHTSGLFDLSWIHVYQVANFSVLCSLPQRTTKVLIDFRLANKL
jgi:hypothetical protein